ncbi:MAG: SipW-dependent-type signal peptide-containing protein [Clostridia bacterium]|nr:SipW-dependent-type signal peptide-containing protein [Clostridia bacterium]
MSKKNRAALRRSLLTLSLVLVVAFAAVGGTLAWLTSSSEQVVNTFTTGKVNITLDEADTNEYGVAVSGASRVTENDYLLMPGHTYVKDPIVHVTADSEPCYLFVEVINELAAIEADTKIVDQMKAKGWENLSGNIYYYSTVVDARDGAKDIPVFETFKVVGTLENGTTYDNKTIKVTAYAIQADGFDTAAEAWEQKPTTWPQ